jgi:hypothetical protein
MVFISCSGCGRSFSYGAWSIHLAQTTNPDCRVIYDEQRAYIPESSDRALSPSPPPEVDDTHGDFFVDSTSENSDFFTWDDGDDDHDLGLSNSDRSSDSDLSWSDAESASAPEPLPMNPPSMPLPDNDSDSDDPMDDERGRLLNPSERRDIEDNILVKPVVIPFPGRAGETSQEAGPSGYAVYEEQVGVESANIYAPFASKADWEFARWAKRRGVGSTAASELMGIDGVSSVL